MDNYYKYLKYKNKYLNYKKTLEAYRNQKGGASNFDINKRIYDFCQSDAFTNPCLPNFGVKLEALKTLHGKDTSSQSNEIIGSSFLNVDGEEIPIVIKVFMSECKTRKARGKYPPEIRKDELHFFNEIVMCKQLTQLFLLSQKLENISWFYYGGICDYSFQTSDNISTCSGTPIPTLPVDFNTGKSPDRKYIYSENSNNYYIEHWRGLYLDSRF
jgi:hypothetical protein